MTLLRPGKSGKITDVQKIEFRMNLLSKLTRFLACFWPSVDLPETKEYTFALLLVQVKTLYPALTNIVSALSPSTADRRTARDTTSTTSTWSHLTREPIMRQMNIALSPRDRETLY